MYRNLYAFIKIHENHIKKNTKLKSIYEIFEKHAVSPAEFEKSHIWWWEHPVAMKEVLLEITEKISQIERAQKE